MSNHTHHDNIPSFPTEFPFPLSDFNLDTVVNPSLVIDPNHIDPDFDFDFDFDLEPEPDLDPELDALEQLFNTPGFLEHLLSEPDPLIDPSGFFDHLLQHSVLLQSDRYPPPPFRCPFADLRPADPLHSEPPPPPLSFLDNILNPPAPSDSLPFGYRRVSSPLNRPPPSVEASANMAPPRDQRPDRLPNGYVDLTAGPDSPSDPVPPPVTGRRRESSTPGPSSKRQKREDGPASTEQRRKSNTPAEVEQIDLSTDNPVQGVLQKQREEAVKAQQKPEEKATTFNSFTCVICMDTPTDLTATACGHLFCHTCLMEALIAGENRTGPNEPKRSQCPVCRKFINRSKTTDIIPLALKKGLATQPRMSGSSAAKATVAPKA